MKKALLSLSVLCFFADEGFCQAPGTKVWEVMTPGIILSSPAIAEDRTIYIGSCDAFQPIKPGWLCSFSPQGTTNWILTFPAGVRSSPAIGPDGTIYVGCWNGELEIVSPSGTYTGVATGGHIIASSAIGGDGTVYVGSITNEFNKLFAFTPGGGIKWIFSMGSVQFDDRSVQSSSPSIGPDGTVYVGSYDKNLYAIKPDGTTNWVFPLVSITNPSPASASVTYASPAIGPDGTIYIGADNGVLYAIDPQGFAKWKFQAAGGVESSAAVRSDGTVYFGCLGFQFYALAADGTKKWSYPCPISSSPALGSDGSIYVGSYDWLGKLFAFDASGSNLWTFTASAPIYSSPAIGPDGTVFFGAGQKLYAVHGTDALMNGSWPMFRRNLKHTARSVQRGIQQPTALPDGNFEIEVNIETGRTYTVEYSTNLLLWKGLTNFVSQTITNQVIDTTATNSTQRFYRLSTAERSQSYSLGK